MAFKRFTRDDLDRLIASVGGPHLSLYLPPPPSINAADQDRIRIGNVARSAQESLAKHWMSEADAAGFLGPLRKLANTPALATPRTHGIAVFLQGDSLETFRVESAVKEHWTIARAFQVRSLLPSLGQLEAYNVLTLSQKRVALFAGTVDVLERRSVPGLEESFEQLQDSLTAEPQLQAHSAASSMRGKQGGKQGAVFHGQGGLPDSEKKDFENYLKRVDDVVCGYLRQSPATPLILAGVDSVTATFRSVCRYDSLLADSLSGNVDHLSADQLRMRVADIVTEENGRQREQDASRIREHDVPTATESERILIAAFEGRIDTLFIDRDASLHGMFMVDRGILKEVHHAPTGDPADESHDLIELAAVQTLKTGGTVHAVPTDAMPVATTMAAALRF
ncbi:hypothetical protein Pla52o_29160 [Novipirellula galeiformis]|uniref:Uncharacterized protein n=1 Tax=Novipirellula galeiformis TaxID=2528004 RepID=A0A5C6CFI4_9BACT|nr:hypothetical protein [Novipirellula galeiformis]TWU23380.1 hypothetical protein Pla52o_29160 [Novipirellula galeiformis]